MHGNPPPPPSGLNYKYFEGTWSVLPDFTALTPTQSGVSPNADINVRPAGRNDNFAFLWEGYINLPVNGFYTFETISDDGSKLYFNSFYAPGYTALVNNDGLHAATSATGSVNISAGLYPIAITFFERTGGETMQVYWTGPGIPRQLIPNSAFRQSTPSSPSTTLFVLRKADEMEDAGSAANRELKVQGLYPNPFTEKLNITFYNSAFLNDVSVALYDLQGRMVFSHHAGNVTPGNTTVKMNLSGSRLVDGVYMATLHVNGKPFKTVKVIKVTR